VKKIVYSPESIQYTTFDDASKETFRLTSKPSEIKVSGNELDEVADQDSNGWTWQALASGGILRINRTQGGEVQITK
jgi:hypothetical protein